MKRSFVTVILAGGKGTRMGSSDKHKVCFEVLGTPVIIRALETYNLCGAMANVVVVGMMSENVMATVNQRFPGTIYAFQERPLGTGNAARKAAEILERMRFDGDVLVVAGDKVIDPCVVRRLLDTHERSRADVTLATAKRPPNSSAGFVIKSARGNIAGIVEEAERRRWGRRVMKNRKVLFFIAFAFFGVAMSAQSVDLGSATAQIRNIASQAAGIIGGIVGLIGIGRCAYKFSNGDPGAVTALIEGIVGLVLGQIAAGML